MAAALYVDNLTVAIDDVSILDGISFNLQQGDIACFLGPSGCGKTTLLRTLAGFLQPASGEILIHGLCASSRQLLIPVEQRNIGMVFQDAALFPHLNIRDNIQFGIMCLPRVQRAQRVAELEELLSLTKCLDKYPHELSYGQQQRVALARAMAPAPQILLLDEPFASLDIELRQHLATEIRLVLQQIGSTAILVSHNQLEGFAMADVIGVMQAGRLLQWDSAFNIYHRPNSPAVADFIGEGVFIPGHSIDDYQIETSAGCMRSASPHGAPSAKNVKILIRPDDIIHDDNSTQSALVEDKIFQGAEFLYTLRLDSGEKVLSLVPSHHNHAIGERIGIRIELDHIVVFPDELF